VAGLDLSSTTDLTGLVFLVEPIEEGEPWRIVPFAWLPDADLKRKSETDRVPYVQWRAEGLSQHDAWPRDKQARHSAETVADVRVLRGRQLFIRPMAD
jgi:hypothetical protein